MDYGEMNDSQLAEQFLDLVAEIGRRGRNALEAINSALKDVSDPDVEEGMAQLEDLFHE